MSVVYAGTDERTGRAIALKWVSEPETGKRAKHNAIERLLHEARTCSQIRHPNVVEVYDVVQDGEQVVLVMERLHGETLARVLERGGMPLDRFITVLMAAMYGVAEAHRIGIVHRDVKPENIFLVDSGDPERPHVKMIDFGIASAPEFFSRAEETRASGHPLNSGRDVLGTPIYMAPEQLSNPRTADARADVYAFGVILYRAITGRYPHAANSLPELVQRMSMPVMPAQAFCASLPSELDRVIGSALTHDRNQRLQSLPALIKELVPFAFARGLYPDQEDGSLCVRGSAHDGDECFTTASPSIPPSYSHSRRRHLPSRGAGALLLLAAAAAALLWTTHHVQPDASSPAAVAPSEEDKSLPFDLPSSLKPREQR